MFDLNYQQSHREGGTTSGAPPQSRACVCGIQTGDSPANSRVSAGRGPATPVGLGDIPAAAFLICWTQATPPPPLPPPRGANWTRLTCSHSGFECVSFCRGRLSEGGRGLLWGPRWVNGEFSIRITIQQCRFRLGSH